MRKLLNILAVIIGLISGMAGVGGVVMLLAAAFTMLRETKPFTGDLLWLMPLLLGACFSFLGFLIASRAWLHVRRPDAGTARDMIGTAIYLIAMMAVFPLFKTSLIAIPVIIGLYLFHRWLVRRIVARAFPPEAVESHA